MSFKTMSPTDSHNFTTNQKELAAGVLKQAAQDLRRFRGRTSAVERELYGDVYSWLISDDQAWPFSFLNVCQLLNLTPAVIREELLDDESLGIFSYYVRRCGGAAHRLQIFLCNTFTSGDNANAADRRELGATVH